MGKPTPRDEIPFQPQVTFEPFEKWGMDFVGSINPPSKQRSYIIVCTDYLTKWAKTKEIKAATEEKVAEFLRENIFYKFGYPRDLVTDQGSQFTSNLIEDLLAHHKIKHRASTPYHPQANGKKALLSIEFEYNTLRVAAQLDLDLSHAQRERLLQLNGLDEHRMQALLHSEVVQLQRNIWHDRHLNEMQFQPGDWELRYDSRYKDFKGKLRTRWLGPYTVEKCNDNGLVLIRTIDEEAIPMLVNGHRLKIYRKPLSRQEFIETVEKSTLVIE
eukprot:PITA_12112